MKLKFVLPLLLFIVKLLSIKLHSLSLLQVKTFQLQILKSSVWEFAEKLTIKLRKKKSRYHLDRTTKATTEKNKKECFVSVLVYACLCCSWKLVTLTVNVRLMIFSEKMKIQNTSETVTNLSSLVRNLFKHFSLSVSQKNQFWTTWSSFKIRLWKFKANRPI